MSKSLTKRYIDYIEDGMSQEVVIKLHNKMWTWMAKKSLKEKRKVHKEEYIKRMDKWGLIRDRFSGNICYACIYNKCHRTQTLCINLRCVSCPLEWYDNKGDGQCGLLYDKWWSLSDHQYKSAAKFALEIANLPMRDIPDFESMTHDQFVDHMKKEYNVDIKY